MEVALRRAVSSRCISDDLAVSARSGLALGADSESPASRTWAEQMGFKRDIPLSMIALRPAEI